MYQYMGGVYEFMQVTMSVCIHISVFVSLHRPLISPMYVCMHVCMYVCSTKANIVLDTMVTMFSEYCTEPFSAEPVTVIYESSGKVGAVYLYVYVCMYVDVLAS